MAITATDTGNDFADAWTSNQWNAARQAVQTQPIGVSADAPAELNQYRTAWNAENNGVYGDIGQEGPAPLQAAVAEAPKNPFTQQTWQGFGHQSQRKGSTPGGALMYDSSMPPPTPGSAPMGGGEWGGGYGQWKYGSAIPEAGSAAYKDYQSYWDNGGYDPTNMYGKLDSTLAAIKARGGTAVDMAQMNQPAGGA